MPAENERAEIVGKPESPLTILQIDASALISVDRANNALFAFPKNLHREEEGELVLGIRNILGDDRALKAAEEYLETVRQFVPERKFPRRKAMFVIPRKQIGAEGRQILEPANEERNKHPLIKVLKDMHHASLMVYEHSKTSVEEVKRYITFFFPGIPFDRISDIDWKALIPTTKKVLWGAYENTGVPFEAKGSIHQEIEDQQLLAIPPLMPGEIYKELAVPIQTEVFKFFEGLETIASSFQRLVDETGIEQEEITEKGAREETHLISAANIATVALREILDNPAAPQSGVMAIHLYRALKEIRDEIRPKISYSGRKKYGISEHLGLEPSLRFLLEPRYTHPIQAAEKLGYVWKNNGDLLAKPVNS